MASSDTEILPNVHPLCFVYKSGRVEPIESISDFVPAGVDPDTGVDSKDVPIDSDTDVKARLYLPPTAQEELEINNGGNNDGKNTKKLPILIYFHGGGFFMESSQAFSKPYHDLLNAIASQAKILIVSINYRLAEQARLPAAYEDSWSAIKWVFSRSDPWLTEHGDFEHVFMAGDSAGANITHNMAMELGTGPQREGMSVEGVALLCPYFWGTKRLGDESIVEAIVIDLAWILVMSPGMTLDDPRVNPIAEGAPSLAGLGSQKAFVSTGGADLLRWRGEAYGDTLKKSGWGDKKVEFKEYEGMGHVFFLNNLKSKEAKDLINRLVAFFNQAVN